MKPTNFYGFQAGDFTEFTLESAHFRSFKTAFISWFHLVKNISPSENIEECFLKLKDIVDLKTGKSIIEDVQNLTWSGREQNKEISGNQPIKIAASHDAVCDVARTNKENIWGATIHYTTWFGCQEINEGDYLLKIVAYGNFKNHPIHYTYQTVLHFDWRDKFKLDKPFLIKEQND